MINVFVICGVGRKLNEALAEASANKEEEYPKCPIPVPQAKYQTDNKEA